MRWIPGRRRWLGYLSLVPVAALAEKSKTFRAPTAPRAVRDIGSWRLIESGTSSRAVLRSDSVRRSSGYMERGARRDGATVRLAMGYWSAPGPRKGHHVALMVYRDGTLDGGPMTVTVRIDEREAGSFDLQSSEVRDLAPWIGGKAEGLGGVKRIRADLLVQDRRIEIFDATLDGTTEVMTEMVRMADYNHAVLGMREAADEDESPQAEGRGCFITSACCEGLGRPDDCWELRTLRRFRDGVMLATADGRRDVATYYRVAPALAIALREEGGRRSFLWLYLRDILPSALAAACGLERLARARYTAMMHRLGRIHRVALDDTADRKPDDPARRQSSRGAIPEVRRPRGET